MQHHLRHGLSFCLVDGHPVFLDIRSDRYFMLPPALERTFIAHKLGQESCSVALFDVLGNEELHAADSSRWCNPEQAARPATRSAIEEQMKEEKLSVLVYLEVATIVCKIKFRLRAVGLEEVLRDLTSLRRKRVVLTEEDICESAEANIIAAATRFLRARSLVPIGSTCLLDSLALATYLADRALPAKLVFGVTLSPFSAHCWVQFRGIALNETVTEAATHTQILVW